VANPKPGSPPGAGGPAPEVPAGGVPTDSRYTTREQVAVVREAGEAMPSSLRLKTVLIVFMGTLLIAVTGATFLVVTREFVRWNATERDDLAWRTTRAANELSRRLASGRADPRVVQEILRDRGIGSDVYGIVVSDAAGKVLGRVGGGPEDAVFLFSGEPGRVANDGPYVRAFSLAEREGKVIGRVAVMISSRRLEEALRGRVLVVGVLACLGALLLSLIFVKVYLGPVLRFAEKTLDKLRLLTETLEHRVDERTAALVEANLKLKQILEKNRAMQRQIMDASRRAGMADVATTVLHNVGNVLNSVNVSASIVIEAVQRSRVVGLTKAAELIRAHEGDWANFFAKDEKGKKLPAYIATLAAAAAHERAEMMKELSSLQQNIDHIKAVVSRQQAQAKSAIGVIETVSLRELLDDAINLSKAAHEKRGILVLREYASAHAARLDRHKLFEMVMNLLSNAGHAVEGQAGARNIAVRVRPRGLDRFCIEVEDTGCGISAEHLDKIFTFGFTTRPGGHGFGLHASACAAAEMGGSLTAHSDGPGRGSRFTIELPVGEDVSLAGVTTLRG
jgi:signal transduction histidine kinase